MSIGSLPLTGERTVPGVASENYWFRRHEAAYEFARSLVTGRFVEVGCGEGYGTAMLAAAASTVLGVDYDAAAVAHAAQRYPAARFVRANLAALPLPDGAVDGVAALQVVEHVWDHPGSLRECRRVLRPGGLLLLTTPNRLTFSPGRDVPVNPFHTHEFTAAELAGLLGSADFRVERCAGLHAGARLVALDARYGSFVDAQLAVEPDGWSERLRLDVASVGTTDFEISDAGVDASLDLVVVARAS